MHGPQNFEFLLVNLTDVVMTAPLTKFKYSRKPGYKDIGLCGTSSTESGIHGTTLLSVTLYFSGRSTLVCSGTEYLVPCMTI